MKYVVYSVLALIVTLIIIDHIVENVSADDIVTADYAPTGWLAKNLPEIAEGLQSGEVTSEGLVKAYLKRIDMIDRDGPKLRSILALNLNALKDARELDQKREAGEVVGPLHGVPILLKDNIESKDPIATTAGALALQNNITGRDSPLVAGLREAGAVILGKTNLSQWANFRSNDSMSGWSALGGQVKNPHILDRNPCGSSSGSGSAMAASLAAGTVGTETNGSIICPYNINGIVGFKPTVGLVPQDHIVPISSSQDTAGPMTKTVRGAAMMLSAMAVGEGQMDFVSNLDADVLKGLRIGVLRFGEGSNQDIITAFNANLEKLKEAGAILVEIEENPVDFDGFWADARNVLYFEFKATINSYLATSADAVETRSLTDLIAFNTENASIELALFDQSIFEGSNAKGDLDDEDYLRARDRVQQATGPDGIDAMLSAHNVAVLVAPSGTLASRIDPIHGDVWPSFPGAGWMPAIAGYPHATVPMAHIHGLPAGLSFIGTKGADADILSVAYAFEQIGGARVDPVFLPTADDRAEIAPALEGVLHP